MPNAESGLKWGAPFYTLDGKVLAALGALKNEVALSIYAPPEAFDDPKGQLEGRSATLSGAQGEARARDRRGEREALAEGGGRSGEVIALCERSANSRVPSSA